jgi:hypothetical protein
MVPKVGLEPTRLLPLPPQDSVSTKFHHFGTKHIIFILLLPESLRFEQGQPVFQVLLRE